LASAVSDDDDDYELDDDLIDGVRLGLSTVAKMGPVFIPQVVYEHG
jgi:hypothetical protein